MVIIAPLRLLHLGFIKCTAFLATRYDVLEPEPKATDWDELNRCGTRHNLVYYSNPTGVLNKIENNLVRLYDSAQDHRMFYLVGRAQQHNLHTVVLHILTLYTIITRGLLILFNFIGNYRGAFVHATLMTYLAHVVVEYNRSTLESALLLSACLTAYISSTAITGRQLIYATVIGLLYVSFVSLTYYFVGTPCLFSLFVIYELFLLPSAMLVWLFSPNKRGVKTSVFFLIWTQLGSMLVLTGVCLIRIVSGGGTYAAHVHELVMSTSGEYCILLGFFIKIPTFPFYFWLVKTHVEVITSFSIFLSGFLVKIALFGLYKFMFIFSLSTKLVAITLAMVSALVTSILFIFQLDLKKVVAYATIQEMGQLTVATFTMHLFNIRSVSMFLITHTILSAKFFYITDIMYRHSSSRSGLVVTGLLTTSPKLAIAVVLGLMLFRGIPFSSKNSVEINMLDVLFAADFSFGAFWLIAVVFIGNLTFSFVFLRTLVFGTNQKGISADLTQTETLVFVLTSSSLVYLPYISY